MRFEAVSDPVEFRERTQTLLADEARHNLIRGILNGIVAGTSTHDDHLMFVVGHGKAAIACALMTPPYNLIVADAAGRDAIGALVAGLDEGGIAVPGVIGNRPTVDWFVSEWQLATGEVADLGMAQGVFALRQVAMVPPTLGSPRLATLSDVDQVEPWVKAFIDEALPNEPRDDKRLRLMVENRLGGEGPGGFWLWDVDDAAVSLSSHGSPTGTGIRIASVYTPPEHRRHGFASALVAAQSQWLLDNGYEFCFLFTDLANPTSNAIYERIGYSRVAEGASYTFSPATPGS